MKKAFRLTVHIADVQKKEVQTDKRTKMGNGKIQFETKRKIYNTLSFYVKDMEEAHKKLAEVRSEYTIQKGSNPEKKDKYDKELYNISFIK